MTTATILIVLYAAMALLLAGMLWRAPSGYEDDEGFHEGPEPHLRG